MEPNIRQSIVDAMAIVGMSRNEMAVKVAPHVSRSQVYAYLSGKVDIGTESANRLMRVAGLKIVEE